MLLFTTDRSWRQILKMVKDQRKASAGVSRGTHYTMLVPSRLAKMK
jgi:hypothetical protein